MCDGPRECDPYAPTRFQEGNAILLAGMAVNDDDQEAQGKLYELLAEMSPVELRALAAAATEVHDAALAAARAMVRRD